MSLRIAICCSNNLVGEGIKRLIDEDGLDIEKTTNCPDFKEVIKTKPDLLIADFNIFFGGFIDELFRHKIGILLIGTEYAPKMINKDLAEFVSKGVIGILSPMTDSAQFRKAIKSIASGELWFNRKKIKDIVSKITDLKAGNKPALTNREVEIVKLICEGHRNKEIMQILNIGEQAVKRHLNNLYKKTDVHDRLQLALYAIKHLPHYLQ